MDRMVVTAGGLERQEHRLGHRAAGQDEPLAEAKSSNQRCSGTIRCWVGSTPLISRRLARIAAILRGAKPIPARTSSVCWPTAGTSPIAASSSVNMKGGSRARTGPFWSDDAPFVARRELLVVPHVDRFVQPAVGDAGASSRAATSAEVLSANTASITAVRTLPIGTPRSGVAETRVGRIVRSAQDFLAEHHPFAFVLQPEDDLAVLRSVRTVWGDGGVAGRRRAAAASRHKHGAASGRSSTRPARPAWQP